MSVNGQTPFQPKKNYNNFRRVEKRKNGINALLIMTEDIIIIIEHQHTQIKCKGEKTNNFFVD